MIEFLAMLSGGVVAFCMGLFYVLNRKKTTSTGKSVSAKITDVRKYKTGYYSYVLTYYIDGVRYEVMEQMFSKHPDRSRIGEKVTIIVDDNDREKFVYPKDTGAFWYSVLAMLPGIIIIILSGILFFTGSFESNFN